MNEPLPSELLEAGRGYEELFVPALLAPWTKHLIKKAGVCEGSQVLDIACGTEVLARDALLCVGTSWPGCRRRSSTGLFGIMQLFAIS